MNNYKLNKMKTRRRILATVYEAMENFPVYEASLDGARHLVNGWTNNALSSS